MTIPTILTQANAEDIFGNNRKRAATDKSANFEFLSNIPAGESETWLIYGGSGSGKTRLIGTCGDRALILNNGNGIDTLKSPLFRELIASKPIIATITEKIGKGGIFEQAEAHDAICDTIDYALEKFGDRFDFVCIDDGTQLKRAAANKALVMNEDMQKSQTMKEVKKWDEMIMAVQDFGQEMSIIETFASNYTTICQQAKKHFILCAHVRQTFKKGERIGDQPVLMKTVPAFTGVDKNPDYVTGYFDNVWYSEVVGGGNDRVWRVTTKGHETLSAKTRMDGIFETVEIVKPNDMFMLNAVNRIREGIKNPKAVPSRIQKLIAP